MKNFCAGFLPLSGTGMTHRKSISCSQESNVRKRETHYSRKLFPPEPSVGVPAAFTLH
jgi:hypothetical protein